MKVARKNAALQRRGPHPLTVFLGVALRETGGDPARLARVLKGIRDYQDHPFARPPLLAPVAAQHGSIRLLDHAPGGGLPVVLVPSLINGPEVLDLAPGASLVERLRARGFRPLVVDWGAPDTEEQALDINGIVSTRLLPLLDTLGEPVAVAGYCLGGTIAAAAAALKPPLKLALIAAPWKFSGYGPERRDALLKLWEGIAPGAAQTGVVPVDLLQPGFWDLDAARAVAKFERFGTMDPDAREARHYVLVEDWVNSGPPIAAAAAGQVFERFYGEDEPGHGRWRVGGVTVDPAALPCPVLNIVSTTDRIVPSEAAPDAGKRIDLAAGHVGMMVGGRARRLLYDPLADWLLA